MEFKEVFFGLLATFLVVTALTVFSTTLNTKYASEGAGNIDTGFMQTSEIDTIGSYAAGVSSNVANSTEPPSVSPDAELTQSKNTFSLIRSMVDFVPKLFRTTGAILGISREYINLGVWAFIFAFGITLAYLLILGVQKWL